MQRATSCLQPISERERDRNTDRLSVLGRTFFPLLEVVLLLNEMREYRTQSEAEDEEDCLWEHN